MQSIDECVVDDIFRRGLYVLRVVISPNACICLLQETLADSSEHTLRLYFDITGIGVTETFVLQIDLRISLFHVESARYAYACERNVNPAHVVAVNDASVFEEGVASCNRVADVFDHIV